ncbi:MAG: sugar-binding domain-containing protein [Staphylococcus rostri]|nr:sugar-binding domain-containing protein [Staphylococcus rostri]MDO5376133.1 sugar-binding domain-containing protein [Staphylococcus rostri]
MKRMIQVQQKLVPDLIDKMYRRFSILTAIQKYQPIGRRTLSEILNLTERVLRSETDLLKHQDLILVKPTGMTLTSEGIDVMKQLQDYFSHYSDDHHLAKFIRDHYNIKEVHVIPGNSDTDLNVKVELGRITGQLLERQLYEDAIVSVTGGSTMAAVSNAMTELPFSVLFVPARGGLGENVVFQANTICSTMAQRTGGNYTTLYVPDQVSEQTYQNLMHEPSVVNTLNRIRQSQFIVHGIGDALKMANRRQSSSEVVAKLQHHNAVGEAFGYYFNQQGEIIHKVKTIGLQLEEVQSKEHIFAVAGGNSKGNAIKAYLEIAPKNTILVTDEYAAKIITQDLLKN